MPTTDICDYCGHSMPFSSSPCPHCGRPARYPNVRAAEAAQEKAALDLRHQSAHTDASNRGSTHILTDFETAVGKTVAVIARPEAKLLELASNDNVIYSTYYDLISSGSLIPEGSQWDVFRVPAEHALFPGYKERMRFAALSFDGIGLTNYGNCFITLREEMIAHRATVFEGNVVMRLLDTTIRETISLPAGYRATWQERAKLCVAKLAEQLDDKTTQDQYPDILLKQGTSSAEDDFVEVHIYGPMTVRTMAQVTVVGRLKEVYRSVLKEKLAKFNVKFQVKK